MNFIIKAIIEAYKNYIWLSVGTVIVFIVLILLFFGWLFGACENKPNLPTSDQTTAEQGNIANTETNKLNNTLQQSNAAINAALEPAKKAAENTANIQSQNYTNTNLSEAEKARCKAYPNSRGCPK